MKKIDIQNAISNYLSNNNFTILDTLSKKYKILSYEEYMYKFNLIYNTYKDSIAEYSEEGKKYLDNMNNFIEVALNETDIENLESYINNNLKSKLQFIYSTREAHLKSIYPESFLLQREASKEAFENIYTELGYDALVSYIQLVKTPSNFSSYLNSNDNRQLVAMKFMLFKTDHHSNSPRKLKRDFSAETIYQATNNNIQESLADITKEKDDYIKYMNQEKENYSNWFSESSEKWKVLQKNIQTNYQI